MKKYLRTPVKKDKRLLVVESEFANVLETARPGGGTS